MRGVNLISLINYYITHLSQNLKFVLLSIGCHLYIATHFRLIECKGT